MSYLARLKNLKAPEDHPTKPTKPPQMGDGAGFVGFVGYPPGGLEKSRGVLNGAGATPANDDGPQLSQLSQPQTSASNDPAPAPVQPPDWAALDRAYQRHHWGCVVCIAAGRGSGLRCGTGAALWGSFDAVDKPLPVRAQPAPATPQPVATDSPPVAEPTEQEAERTSKRLALFAARGVRGDDAEVLAQRLLMRDREGDRRGGCAECRQLVGIGPGRWRCGDNSHPNVNELAGAWVGAAFVDLRLHRCGGFSGIQHL